MQRRARVGREVVINPSVRGGKRVQNSAHTLCEFSMPILAVHDASGSAIQQISATPPFCAQRKSSTLESVEVVQVGTRGHAKQAQTAARCPTWVRGACRCSGRPATRWTGTRYFVVSELQETSHCGPPLTRNRESGSPRPRPHLNSDRVRLTRLTARGRL